MAGDIKRVLFLCTGNSCRSIMAEKLLNHLGKDHYQGFSAGSFPTGKVHPKSIETLIRQDIDPGIPRSKSWDEYAEMTLDFVVTVCDQAAGETCPVFPGQPKKLHWSTPDPAKAKGTEQHINAAFDEVFQALKTRIEKELLV